MLVGNSKTEIVHYEFIGDIEQPAPNTDLILAGSVISIVGAGVLYAGIIRQKFNWAPYATVSGIAETYNKKLIVGIKGSF